MRHITKRIMGRVRRARPYLRGEVGAHRLSRAVPGIDDYRRRVAAETQHLRAAYDAYVESVSTSIMAVSWEAACFLYVLAWHRRPRRVLDLGSGFSSYVLRCYAQRSEDGVVVYSVDDDEAWLEKTRAFLAAQQLPTDKLLSWNAFRQSQPAPFDLIFHDLGSMETRKESLPYVLRLAAEQGIVVLDDMHKQHYQDVAVLEARRAGLPLYSARKFTLDRFGRFSEFVIAQHHAV